MVKQNVELIEEFHKVHNKIGLKNNRELFEVSCFCFVVLGLSFVI